MCSPHPFVSFPNPASLVAGHDPTPGLPTRQQATTKHPILPFCVGFMFPAFGQRHSMQHVACHVTSPLPGRDFEPSPPGRQTAWLRLQAAEHPPWTAVNTPQAGGHYYLTVYSMWLGLHFAPQDRHFATHPTRTLVDIAFTTLQNRTFPPCPALPNCRLTRYCSV